MAELVQSKMNGRIVGTLMEKKLEEVDSTRTINGVEKECKAIRGTLSVKTNNGTFDISVWTSSLNGNGEESKLYKSYETVMNDYVSASDNVDNADTIDCLINMGINDYCNREKTEVRSSVRFRLSIVNRVADKEGVELSSDLELECYIDSIKKEKKNDEPTGRLIVEVIGVDYSGNAQPYTLYVEEDLADDFEDIYSVGDNAMLYLTAKMAHVGGEVKKKKTAFGKKGNIESSGYDRLELVIIGGEDSYEDIDDDDYEGFGLTKKEVKKLKEDREILLEQKLNDAKAKDNTPKSNGGFERKPMNKEEVPF